MERTEITDTGLLGKIIRRERRLQHLTQQDLADTAGVSVRFLGDLERGKHSCEIGKVLAVLQVLGISIHPRFPGDKS